MIGKGVGAEPAGRPPQEVMSGQERHDIVLRGIEEGAQRVQRLRALDGATLDDEEQAAMDDLLECVRRIRSWGLRRNEGELTSAVHVVQSFIIQRMLRRVSPAKWSAWYEVEGGEDRGGHDSAVP